MDVSGQYHAPTALIPVEKAPISTEAGWATEPVWKFWRKEKSLQAHAVTVEALCYKLEGRGFDSRWSHWDFSLT